MDGETSIGTNIRRIRHWRGLSLEAAAGLAGFSKGYLSMIENGERGVDRRSTLSAIAGALRVSLADLTGDGLAIRAALLDTALDEPRTPTRALAELAAQTQRQGKGVGGSWWAGGCRGVHTGRRREDRDCEGAAHPFVWEIVSTMLVRADRMGMLRPS